MENVSKSWEWGQRLIQTIVEPFIAKFSPIKIPRIEKHSTFLDITQEDTYKRIVIYIIQIQRLTILACTPESISYILKLSSVNQKRTPFSGAQISGNACERGKDETETAGIDMLDELLKNDARALFPSAV